MTHENTWRSYTQINNNCHAELVSASTPLITVTNKEKILNQVQDDNRRGFTLIELLVVVLIIGILAAVAAPQYQKTVRKSRAVQVKTLMRSLYRAQQFCNLEHGTTNSTDCTQLSNLAINIPFRCSENATNTHCYISPCGWMGNCELYIFSSNILVTENLSEGALNVFYSGSFSFGGLGATKYATAIYKD